jgi:hypothetical protein
MADPDSIRDWLYERMRGAKGQTNSPDNGDVVSNVGSSSKEDGDEATELLRGIRDNLAMLVAHAKHTASNEEN